MEGRRIKRLRVTGSFFVGLFGRGNHIHMTITDGLPTDARLVAWDGDRLFDMINLLFESESFPSVPEGEDYPTFGPIEERSHACEGSSEPECVRSMRKAAERIEEFHAARV